jgi:hypothetical protein
MFPVQGIKQIDALTKNKTNTILLVRFVAATSLGAGFNKQ